MNLVSRTHVVTPTRWTLPSWLTSRVRWAQTERVGDWRTCFAGLTDRAPTAPAAPGATGSGTIAPTTKKTAATATATPNMRFKLGIPLLAAIVGYHPTGFPDGRLA